MEYVVTIDLDGATVGLMKWHKADNINDDMDFCSWCGEKYPENTNKEK